MRWFFDDKAATKKILKELDLLQEDLSTYKAAAKLAYHKDTEDSVRQYAFQQMRMMNFSVSFAKSEIERILK